MAHIHGLLVTVMKAIGLIINKMVLEHTIIQKEVVKKEHGKMASIKTLPATLPHQVILAHQQIHIQTIQHLIQIITAQTMMML